MFSLSDIIDAKQAILARYETPEYQESQLNMGYKPHEIRIAHLDREIVLTDLLIELYDLELAAQKATMPVNIEE
jgi:hypothetical protein